MLLARRGDPRPRGVSRARSAARHARPARGVPRDASCRRSSTGYAAGLTPNPCMRCNGAFRFDGARRVRRARGRGRALDGPLRPARRAGRDAARRARRRPARRTSRTCSRRSTRRCSTASASRSARQTKAEVRAEAAAAGLAAARRPESQEACFLAGGDYRGFLERSGLAAGARATIVDEAGDGARAPRGPLAVHARPAPRPRGRRGRAAPRRPLRPRRTPSSSGRGARSALAARDVRGRTVRRRSQRAEAKLRYRSPPVGATSAGRRRASPSSSTSRSRPSRRDRSPCSTTTTPSSEPA